MATTFARTGLRSTCSLLRVSLPGPSRTIVPCSAGPVFIRSAGNYKRFNQAPEPEPVAPQFFTNEDIPFSKVQLVDPETRQLLPPQPLRDILSTIDTRTHELTMVQAGRPIVKIIDLAAKADAARSAERKKAIFRAEQKEKNVQVSWTSETKDVLMKVQLGRQLLTGGNKLQVMFAPKAGQWKTIVAEDRKEWMIQQFDEGLADIAQKWKEDDRKGKSVYTFWQPFQDIRKEAVSKTLDSKNQLKEGRDAKKEARRLREEKSRLKAEEKRKSMPPPVSSLAPVDE